MTVERIQRTGLSYRLRFQAVGVLLCAILPYLVRSWLPFGGGSNEIFLISIFASFGASLLGLFFLRNINSYPGVEGSAYIVPAFCLSFGMALTLVLMFRIGYSRYLIASSFVLNIIFFYVVHFTKQRQMRFSVAVVPGEDTARLMEIDRIRWVPLTGPDADLPAVSAVAVDLRSDLDDAWERRLADYALAGMPVYHSKHLRESLTGRVELEHLSENSFGTLTPVSAYMTLKHAVDWVVALIALIVLMPFFVVLGIAIMIDSPGGPIFRQRRIGYRGHPFLVWKFRTMTAAHATDPATDRTAAMTQAGDIRVTRIGRFLRTSRVDELPQLVNVLKGEMSWIGPRPEAEVLSRWYEAEIPFYRYRHIVRPGITGWAQVSQGHVAEVDDVREKSYYDFYYIKNFSPWLDLLICARTIRTMLTGFGAR